jgi:hypothetical protein
MPPLIDYGNRYNFLINTIEVTKMLLTPTGNSVISIVELFDSLYGYSGPMPTTWAEFEGLRKQFPQLEELYQQFY